MATSQVFAFSVLRTHPRRCGHQVYSSVSPNWCATSSAILFSKPSPARLENGRLFGSAQTRRARRPGPLTGASGDRADPSSVAATAITTPARARRTLEGEDIQHASFGRISVDV